ncbi:TPA: hypothetical protein ACF3JC_002808 [Enterobacter hormaechei]|uniref:hypothetical protein n=1 Tax=Enterobacter hormaechei TaxID=158836 RepID=UPI0014960692|nr:hypothetical protein [Enterobacter hormaechei]MCK1035053.1 hypothetical protein [Enterobacter hormaechei subsp. xiangfangensis]HAT7673653.1 hypothetical protein [Enterobacter hormaechei subsp. xiangfangensis]
MNVNRYEFEDYGTNEPDGRYVTYEDYAALEDRCLKLAVENAGLKNAITAVSKTSEECEINGDELKYVVEPSEFDALTDLLDETPATDAFLAEVRAQGADECVRQLVTSDDDDFTDAPNVCAMVANQLRKGVQS